eukprot:TRINITY_DN590_c0_g1_i2.p1 TRINITY_DN590_c0_g1~~TRINITY_DN590_c0_g1_i2.p1  ORF type:complete len:948 (+),score=314.10 TRINITY_DN590_c0_g1_i2:144-2987(+)
MTSAFDEARFRRQVDAAISTVRTVLDNARHPTYPADVSHHYNDKYLLAEFLTNTTVASLLNTFSKMGLDETKLKQLLSRSEGGKRSVTLRFTSEEGCEYDREEVRKVKSPTSLVETKSIGAIKSTKKLEVVTKVTEYFWKFKAEYSLFAFIGNAPTDDPLVLCSHGGKTEVKTTSKKTPKPKVSVLPSIDINITWLLKQLSSSSSETPAPSRAQSRFSIDREHKKCHTPRRNPQIIDSLAFANRVSSWCAGVRSYFLNRLWPMQQNKEKLDMGSVNDRGVFVPVVPLFEETAPSSSSSSSSSDLMIQVGEGDGDGDSLVLLRVADINGFLSEETRSLAARFTALTKTFPSKGGLVTVAEVHLVVALAHVSTVVQHYSDGVDYIEDMLRKQLIAAIGKVVKPSDFAEYMEFHYRKLYKGKYEPHLFSHAIRRPDHYPEGVVSIESITADGGAIPQPIRTISSKTEATHPMRFAINASTDVSFLGSRHLHAWMSHKFSGDGESSSPLTLVARARQFSSFILLVGRIASAEVFQPKAALLVQNKDDLKLPLLLETIPSAKEFKDAIESLSPEQQRFAKAFRGMQLESTLFGICVIQIKPQLEKLLRIPDDGLTKEIQLTQDLMELFIKYQIPSDLISYPEDNDGASLAHKLTVVKGYVKAMHNMIEKSKEKELKQAEQEALYAQPLAREILHQPAPMMKTMSSGGGRGGGGGMRMMSRAMPSSSSSPCPPPPACAPVSACMSSAPGAPPPSLRRADPAPVLQEQAQSQPEAQSEDQSDPDAQSSSAAVDDEDDVPEGLIDYTQVPQALERKFGALDEDGALRPTIIKPGTVWERRAQKALLAKPHDETLRKDEQKREREKAFDLLDALSRSGSLVVDQAELHVVLASTHCFDKTLVNTVVQDNVNPIEKVERSSLIIASTIHNASVAELVKPSQLERVKKFNPILFSDAQ